jgi:formate C-acetyltransferase
MDRIESLRLLALDNKHSNVEFYYKFHKRYKNSEITEKYERYADAFYYAFSNLTPVVDKGELIIGKPENHLTDAENDEWFGTLKDESIAEWKDARAGQDSHMAIDYELLLGEGIEGVISRIDSLADPEKDSYLFYSAAKKCLSAVLVHSENYADLLSRRVNEETSTKIKEELLELSEICRRVPRHRAKSFHEAVQSVHFISHALSLNPLRLCDQQFQLGRPDQYLYPFYKADIESGRITKERAQLILDCLGIQINNRVPRGLSSGYMVGGRDRNGKAVQNELTLMLMDVIDHVRLVYPAVGLCYNNDMEEIYLSRACEILAKGRSHPAIFNDDIIAEGLMSYGVGREAAHNYIHSTCVEITPIASSNVWVASPYTNMPAILLDCLNREYDTFDDLLSEVFSRLDASILRNFEEQDNSRKRRESQSVNPLLSCFVDDCLARGLDIDAGGAKYNWIMPSFVGVANLVDSLYAVKKVVFDKREMPLGELREILDNNFADKEDVRQKLLNSIEKYGNDNDDIDVYFGMITEHLVSECKKYKSFHHNADIIPSVFCWVMHEYFGRKTGATPDGRFAGFPLGDGSGPCQGREMCGPTASILSSTKWSHRELIGGVAVNMKFSKKTLGENSLNTLKSLIKAYIQRGGFELQINVIDKETLLSAREDPENYRDLVVRIGGYSDFFVKLSVEMQNEVILRTEHTI